MENDYKVLYRKYRPSNFDEVIGQKYSIQMLKNAVINNKISHAYLFTGPRGTGKTSTAKIFAKTINCENPSDGIPCGKCNSCINIHNNADIIEIDAASNNGVEQVRELINNVKIAPSFSKYKVYIIDEVHMLSKAAFNALLLTLEEPPSHIVFILATTNIESVPITILSRCQRYDFKKIGNTELITHLKSICEKENITITEDALLEIAYLAEGGCRDALSILNQLSTSNHSIDLNVVLANYGSVSFVQINTIVSAFINNEYDEIKTIFDHLREATIDYKFFLKKMIDVLFQKGIEEKEKNNFDLFLKIKDVIFELNGLINQINITIDPFLLIFLVFVRFMETGKHENTLKVEEKTANETESQESSSLLTSEMEKVVVKEEIPLKSSINMEMKAEKKEKTIEMVVDSEWQSYVSQLKSIRLNNCFAEADKKYLLKAKEKWESFVSNVAPTNGIKTTIMDSNVVLSSEKINIITHMQVSMVELFNNELLKIQEEYKKIIGEEILLIALCESEWDESKKDYMKKLKEHYAYTLLDEPTYQQNNITTDTELIQEEEKSFQNDEFFAIFDQEKIEVQ